MAINLAYATGSQTATLGVEHTLGTDPDTTSGIYTLVVDTANMTRADFTELRVYEKARTGDTQRQIAMWPLGDAQTNQLFVSPALPLGIGFKYTLKQTAGVGQAYPWSLRRVF